MVSREKMEEKNECNKRNAEGNVVLEKWEYKVSDTREAKLSPG